MALQVYGFGGKKKAEGKAGAAHHCFALNGNESDVRRTTLHSVPGRECGLVTSPPPHSHYYSRYHFGQPEVQGIDGVLQAYEKAFEHWILSGPTNFAEVRRVVSCVCRVTTAWCLSCTGQIISRAADMAKEAVAQQRQNHFILLILTDGYHPRLPSLNHHNDQRTNSLYKGLSVYRSIT